MGRAVAVGFKFLGFKKNLYKPQKPNVGFRFLFLSCNLIHKSHSQILIKSNQIKSNLIVSIACIARLHSSDD